MASLLRFFLFCNFYAQYLEFNKIKNINRHQVFYYPILKILIKKIKINTEKIVVSKLKIIIKYIVS